MDKSWMLKKHITPEYIDGVEYFLKFADNHIGEDNPKFCPCKKCLNLFEKSTREIRFHMYKYGIDPSYTQWTYHGESVSSDDSANVHTPVEMDQQFDKDTGDDFLITEEILQATREQYMGDPEKFQEILRDADEPLYENCSKYTKLSALVKIFHVKAKGGWSDVSFSRLLELVGDLLPDGHLLPLSMDEVKKTLSVYGLKYQKIHACRNDCILYRNECEDMQACPDCGSSRYKEGTKNTPAKVLWYFPPIPRFKNMFQSVEMAKNLTWHATEREIDDKLRHPADSPAWKLIDLKWPGFAQESRNLRLALSADGINPHSSLSTRYSCWPVLLITYNLPPWLCMKRKFMMLTMLISGPRQPGNNIDKYFRLVVDDLNLMWEEGVEVYDAYQKNVFTLKAVLLWTISDFPAFGNLSGHSVKGYYACPICSKDTDSERLKHSKKNVYRASRRFLERSHPYRRDRKSFDGKQELRDPPRLLTGEEILAEIAEIVTWGKKDKVKQSPTYSRRPQHRSVGNKEGFQMSMSSKRPRKENKGSNTGPSRCWKKKSIFFELEYWKHLLIRHNLDVMHIEKNVCESIIGTLLNIPDKTKDGLNARLDLVDMGIREKLAPEVRNGKPFLPAACYTLSRDEKTRVCKILHGLKVPDGYSSNFSRLVSMKDLKLYGLKSHDHHVLMQQLLPVAIRSVLPKHVRCAIIRFCSFFNAICAKVVDVSELLELQKEVVTTLCLLEKYFPPSFFDIMVHLTIHLVKEVQYGGPVHLRWMYAFEREMSVLKGYVRNRNRPEGCIAENYVAEESIEFLSEFFPSLNAVGVPSSREVTHDDMVLYGSPPKGGKLTKVDSASLEQAHLYVLQNTNDVQPYIGIHINELGKNISQQSRLPKRIQDEHNRTFSEWLKGRVFEERLQSGNNVSEFLRWIADGPFPEVLKYSTYVINGYRFSTKERDASRVNQNSGVSLVATAMHVSSAKDKNPLVCDMSYYGVILDIWLLDYGEFHVPVFKCEWVHNNSGVKIDELGFTLVDRRKVGWKSEPFILASQAKQVFYVNDEYDPNWSVVLAAPRRCYLDGEKDNDLYDGNMEDPSRAELFPSVESFDMDNETQLAYLREDVEGVDE